MEPIGGEDPDVQYEFCCNTHIIRAVKIVAIIGLVFNPLWAFYMAIFSPVIPYDFALVSICLYALILVAVFKENAKLLIPYLIFNGIIIAARIVYCIVILYVICGKAPWDQWRHDHPISNAQVEKTRLIVHLVANYMKILLNIWFQHVIYCGYLYLAHRAEAAPLIAGPIPVVVTTGEPNAYIAPSDIGGYQQSVPTPNA